MRSTRAFCFHNGGQDPLALRCELPRAVSKPDPGALPMTTATERDTRELRQRRNAPLQTPTDLKPSATSDITAALNAILADVFALYLKTKNFHWHMSGRHFRDYHLLLDEQSEQIFAMSDDIAERARKIGGSTLRSIGDISHHQRLKDNNDEFVTPKDMLSELSADNLELTRSLRFTHQICDRNNDVASASLIETWIDQTERRTWFLSETARQL